MEQEISSLHDAAGQGDRSAVKAFLARGVAVDAVPNDYCHTPLANAARHGHLRVVKLLLAHGAAINGNKYGAPLKEAIEGKQPEMAFYLLAQGADWSKVEKPVNTAISNELPEVAEALLQRGAAAAAEEASAALLLAAGKGQLGVVECILAKGAAVNGKNPYGQTALHVAAEEGRLDVVRRLLSTGADVSAVDDHLRTALHLAASKGRDEVARALLGGGSAVDAPDVFGATPLYQAVRNGIVSTTRVLTLSGADPRIPDSFGNTILQRAGDDGRLLEILRQAGASDARSAERAADPDQNPDAEDERARCVSYVARKVVEIIADVPSTGIDPSEILPSTNIFNDLNFDSLDSVMLVMNLEDEFGIQIPDEEAEKLITAGDAADHVVRKLLPPSPQQAEMVPPS